ncbi:hypothetical protein MNBD_ACTINO02-701, partial [hydrothermal vent metagenome]
MHAHAAPGLATRELNIKHIHISVFIGAEDSAPPTGVKFRVVPSSSQPVGSGHCASTQTTRLTSYPTTSTSLRRCAAAVGYATCLGSGRVNTNEP